MLNPIFQIGLQSEFSNAAIPRPSVTNAKFLTLQLSILFFENGDPMVITKLKFQCKILIAYCLRLLDRDLENSLMGRVCHTLHRLETFTFIGNASNVKQDSGQVANYNYYLKLVVLTLPSNV